MDFSNVKEKKKAGILFQHFPNMLHNDVKTRRISKHLRILYTEKQK